MDDVPAADVVLLPLCIGLALVAVIYAALSWRRGKRARAAQGVGWALVPVALYLTGLLALLWNGAVAVVGWASRLVFSPTVWAGVSLLVVAVVVIGVGGMLARRGGSAQAVPSGKPKAAPIETKRPARPSAAKKQQTPEPVDEDLAEIEAILKNRGIN